MPLLPAGVLVLACAGLARLLRWRRRACADASSLSRPRSPTAGKTYKPPPVATQRAAAASVAAVGAAGAVQASPAATVALTNPSLTASLIFEIQV